MDHVSRARDDNSLGSGDREVKFVGDKPEHLRAPLAPQQEDGKSQSVECLSRQVGHVRPEGCFELSAELLCRREQLLPRVSGKRVEISGSAGDAVHKRPNPILVAAVA